MEMKTVTVTYGRWVWNEEDDVVVSSSMNYLNDPDYVQYGQAEVEVEIPSRQEQDRVEIRNLRKKITETRASSQIEIERLEDRIQQLMALE